MLALRHIWLQLICPLLAAAEFLTLWMLLPDITQTSTQLELSVVLFITKKTIAAHPRLVQQHNIACRAVDEEAGEDTEMGDEAGEGTTGSRQGVVGWAVNTASSTVRGVARTAGSAAGGIASRAGKFLRPFVCWASSLLVLYSLLLSSLHTCCCPAAFCALGILLLLNVN